jgi:hypothetical protein
VAVNVPPLSGVPPIPTAMLDPHESTHADPESTIGVQEPLMLVDDEKLPVTFAETVETSGYTKAFPLNADPETGNGVVATSCVVHVNDVPSSTTVGANACTAPSETHAENDLLAPVVPLQIPSYCPLPERAACVIVNGCPAIVTVPERLGPFVFAAMMNDPPDTVPPVRERTSTG